MDQVFQRLLHGSLAPFLPEPIKVNGIFAEMVKAVIL